MDLESESAVPSESYMGIQLPKGGTYWIEPGNHQSENRTTTETFQEQLKFMKFYRTYFLDKEHFNYLATSTNVGLVVLSVRYYITTTSNKQQQQLQQQLSAETIPLDDCFSYSAQIMLRTSEKTYYYCGNVDEPVSETNTETASGTASSDTPPPETPPTSSPIMNPVILAKKALPTLEAEGFHALHFPGASKLILSFDEFSLQLNFKFGVIYQRAGQFTEEELLSNTEHSNGFEDFLGILGERVKLKGFGAFRGGLDVSLGEKDSEDSVYTKVEWPNIFGNNYCCNQEPNGNNSINTGDCESEIMFHVSTLLPFTQNDRQQLARKRHIGNDIVSIVFQEPGAVFNPAVITSHFLHVYIIVQHMLTETNDSSYRVLTVARDGVPFFLPEIRTVDGEPFLFRNKTELRSFLLEKLVNAEIAATKAVTFAKLQLRTRQFLFDTLSRDLLSRVFELFAVGGGLCLPFGHHNKTPVASQSVEMYEKQPLSPSVSKRSGSILKTIRKTFYREKRPSSLSSMNDNIATSQTNCEPYPPQQGDAEHHDYQPSVQELMQNMNFTSSHPPININQSSLKATLSSPHH